MTVAEDAKQSTEKALLVLGSIYLLYSHLGHQQCKETVLAERQPYLLLPYDETQRSTLLSKGPPCCAYA